MIHERLREIMVNRDCKKMRVYISFLSVSSPEIIPPLGRRFISRLRTGDRPDERKREREREREREKDGLLGNLTLAHGAE